ncbi:VWA domain-containing protein [Propionibacteriaceae bacterium Y1923]|uniref:VWA domain-containing protein n=1 Tax=Aestuariimicrobium sp. Y1814 TaxID=3418742 RepID=UPI003C299D0D
MSKKPFLRIVLAVLVALGMVVTTVPRAAADDPAPNPPWPSYCGLRLGIILDLSGSLSNTHVQQSKDASVAAIQALVGTNSAVGLHTFSTASPHVGSSAAIEFLPVSVATSASAQPLIDYTTGFDRGFGGSTNWAGAFERVTSLDLDYDAVLMVTDGYPNALAPAIDAANVLKNAGTRVVGVGVGSGVNDVTIKQISSDDAYFPVASFDALVDSLKDAALESCRGSVNITKLVDEDDGNPAAPAAGWTFNGTGSEEGSAVTAASGVASLTYTSDQASVTITEQSQAGYVISPQGGFNAVCTINGSPLTVTNVPNGFQFGPLTSTDVVICTVVNIAEGDTPPVTTPPVTTPPVTTPPVSTPPPSKPRPLPDTGA